MIDSPAARKTLVLAALVVTWEVYARILAEPLLFPTFTATVGQNSATVFCFHTLSKTMRSCSG